MIALTLVPIALASVALAHGVRLKRQYREQAENLTLALAHVQTMC